MSIREYQFINGIETSTSPNPATPSADADAVTLGYTNSTYAKRSSYYDKQTSNANVKAISSADRSDGMVVFNTASNVWYRFDSGSSAADDGDSVLQPDSGTGRWLKVTNSNVSNSGDSLIQQFDAYIATLTAAEALSAGDACCLAIHNGTGSNLYRIFKADADAADRSGFIGFARSAVTVTPQISTYTISAAYVTGNSIPITINERTYSTTYASSSDATLQALATLIATDEDVQSASVTVVGGNQTGTDDRVITITSKGALALNITNTTVSGGASQPTVTIASSQTASGGTVDITSKGIQTGLSSLNVGDIYYVSNTAGAITATPPTNAILVGQALSSTVLCVKPNDSSIVFGQSSTYVRAKGGTTTTTTTGTASVEHFNFNSWTTSTTSATTSRMHVGASDAVLNKKLYMIDGFDTSGTLTATFESYNKSSWSTLSNRTTFKACSSTTVLSGNLIVGEGSSAGTATGNGSSDIWNGSSWTNAAFTLGNTNQGAGGFTQGSLARFIGGIDGATIYDAHQTWNGTSTGTGTVVTLSGSYGYATTSASSKGFVGGRGANNTHSYQWNGSSWDASATMPYSSNNAGSSNRGVQNSAGFNTSSSVAWVNGGTDSSNNAIANTASYNGTSWTSGTSSNLSRLGCGGGII